MERLEEWYDPEFRIITDSYGPVMHELGITEKIHPEMAYFLSK